MPKTAYAGIMWRRVSVVSERKTEKVGEAQNRIARIFIVKRSFKLLQLNRICVVHKSLLLSKAIKFKESVVRIAVVEVFRRRMRTAAPFKAIREPAFLSRNEHRRAAFQRKCGFNRGYGLSPLRTSLEFRFFRLIHPHQQAEVLQRCDEVASLKDAGSCFS